MKSVSVFAYVCMRMFNYFVFVYAHMCIYLAIRKTTVLLNCVHSYICVYL